MKKIAILLVICLVFQTLPIHLTFANTVNEGLELMNNGKYQEALVIFDAIIKKNPQDTIAHYYKGVNHVALLDDSSAIISLEKALSINPQYTKPYLDAAKVYARLNQLDKALVTVDKLLSIDTSHINANLERGHILMALDRKVEALESYQRERRLNNNPWTTYYTAWAMIDLGKYSEAINMLSGVPNNKNNQMNVIAIKALALAKEGKKNDASQLLEQGLALASVYLDPRDFSPAWSYHQLGQTKVALDMLEKEIKQNPNAIAPLINKARIFVDQENYYAALHPLKRAISLDASVRSYVLNEHGFKSFVDSNAYTLLLSPHVMVDGMDISVEAFGKAVPSLYKSGELMFPIYSSAQNPRNLFQRLGGTFVYDDKNVTITSTKGNKKLFIDVKKGTATFNGKLVSLKAPPQIINRVIYVPLSLVTESYGLKVEKMSGIDTINIHKFSDVKTSDWFYIDLSYVSGQGMIEGYNDNTFRPNDIVSVEQFTAMLIKALGHTVSGSSSYWADNYIKKAFELGLIQNNEFVDYTKPIKREEMAAMINRALSFSSPTDLSTYEAKIKDINTGKSLYKNALVRIYAEGFMTLSSGKILPNGTVTRASAAVIVARIIDASRRSVPQIISFYDGE